MKQVIIIFTTIVLGIALAAFVMSLKPKGEAMTDATHGKLDKFTQSIESSDD